MPRATTLEVSDQAKLVQKRLPDLLPGAPKEGFEENCLTMACIPIFSLLVRGHGTWCAAVALSHVQLYFSPVYLNPIPR